MRLPAPERGEWVYLFDVLTASALPVTSHSDARRMLDRDRRWWERARDSGARATQSARSSSPTTTGAQHFGDQWPRLRRIKRRYDPDAILTPGPGIF
jgi:FAD/FMN-containing dehydrogenase